jgi:hypothetical protein
MSIKYSSQESLLAGATAIPDVPDVPTISSVSNVGTSRPYNNGSATLSISQNTTGGTPSSFTVLSNPGSISVSGSSPITVTGLQSGTSYSFAVTSTNSTGVSAVVNSSSITATTVPQAPTIGTVTKVNDTTVSVPFTAGENGGSTITGYTIISNPAVSLSYSGTSSPITVTGSFSGTHTFTIAAINANGTSQASSASNSIQVVQLSSVSGGTLSSDSTYYYRKFTSTGNLVVSNSPLTADIMVIAGGGGGGAVGGGGAGGFRVISGQSLSANTYTATIGAGGARRTGSRFSGDSASFPTNGINSSFIGGSISISATGGGKGAEETPGPSSGGSGGGGCVAPGASGNAGGYSPSEGNSGGGGQSSSNIAGGGGGGAGGNGGTGSGSSGGSGGSGNTSYSSWATATSTGVSNGYAGGGGGGAYQGGSSGTGGPASSGGGRGGAANQSANNGADNTGGGGGGDGYKSNGWLADNGAGAGGSGLVIVRYLKSAVGG